MLVSSENVKQRRLQSARPTRNAQNSRPFDITADRKKEGDYTQVTCDEKLQMPEKLYQESSDEGEDEDYEQILDDNVALAPIGLTS